MSKKVVIPLAEGVEELEAVAIIDVLRRAGVDVTVAGVNERDVKAANGVVIKTDLAFDSIVSEDFDMVVLPGGWGGTKVLAQDSRVLNLLHDMDKEGKLIGAICAAPYALDQAGLIRGAYTCYPGAQDHIQNGNFTDAQNVVIEGNVMTSRGPGTAICFGLAIAKELAGEETYNQLKEGLLANYC
ncbi:MAG: DJ-1 family glyoxalase III [Campylobacterota bacterium]